MSQDNTYQMSDLPPEAAMTLAMEDNSDAPPPAAQIAAPQEAPARVLARTSAASQRLSRLRHRMQGLHSQDIRWMDATHMPIGQSGARSEPPKAAGHNEQQRAQNRTITNGAALTTLMRSAVRQHAKAPALAQVPRPMHSAQAASQAQMRGALRQVIRNAQQPV